MDVYYLYQPGENVEVISVYEQKNPLEPYAEDERYPYGIATAVVKTSEGAAWGVLGYAPWKGIISLNKRDQFLNLADYISGNKLAARVISPVQAVLLPRENSKGETVAVSLINCTIGATGEIELLIRRPASENFRFMSQTQCRNQVQSQKPEHCQNDIQSQTQCRNQMQSQKLLSFKRAGEDYIVTIPNLEAWTVGTVFCDD